MKVIWRWLPAVAWMALIFALSAQSGLRVSDDASVDGPIRHVVHIGELRLRLAQLRSSD